MPVIERAACIGAGVIGAGWAARMLLNGIDVAMFDPDPDAPRKVAEVMDNATHAYERMTVGARPRPGQLRFAQSIADAVHNAEFVQESVPERLDLKQRVLLDIDSAAAPSVPIASSTSGLLPSEMQAGLANAERVLVGHPFNPVYLLPLVELVAGADTGAAAMNDASTLYAGIGMKPIRIKKEIDAFVGDRLQEALWREALWLINDDIADVSDVDDIIRYSFGLRWAQMGVFQVYRVAGGEAGMRHFMAQFGPALKWPWTKLMDVPELSDALIDKISQQSDEQAAGASIRELERIRDDNLVRIMESMETGGADRGWGAGALLSDYKRMLAKGRDPGDDAQRAAGARTHSVKVLPQWLDYNGHMTEYRYVQVFGDATDAVLAIMGCDAHYVASGASYYTVESHVRHLDEASEGEALDVHTRVVAAADKQLHLFHSMFSAADRRLLATSEQLLLHVDTQRGKVTAAPAAHFDALEHLIRAAGDLPPPRAAGRRVGQRI